MNETRRPKLFTKSLSSVMIACALLLSLLGTACSGCRDFGKLACQPRLRPFTPAGER